jgi:hypothetical protein
MSLKTFKDKKNDKKLIPKLVILSYALMILGVIVYCYAFMSTKVPSGKILYHPDWEILKGGSLSSDFDYFTLSDKEAAQLYIIAPFFIAMGSLLKLLGIHRK